jgi:electron transfer flavoprotein-quinone oxidoreductase
VSRLPEKFDVIVVGAGPAGCAAAIWLARRGYDVVVLEKAKIPGHRNVTGGILYTRYLRGYGALDLLPDLEETAPLERRIVSQEAYILSQPTRSDGRAEFRSYRITGSSLLTRLGLTGLDYSTGKDFSVLRAKLDRYLASRVMEAGGMVATEQTAERLIWEDSRVVGVTTTNDELRADVVIDASGVTSTLVEQAGLRGRLRPEDLYLGVKHVYKMDPATIESRFGTGPGEGRALFFLGEFMRGVKGGGFIYPNRDSISVGVVASLDSLLAKCTREFEQVGKPLDLLEEMEAHPFVAQFIGGGRLVEYSAHNVPKGYRTMLQKPYTAGFMVVGDALGCFYKLGALLDGMRKAIATGIMAAQTYALAKKRNRFDESTLSVYRELLQPIYEEISRSKWNSRLTESNFAYNTLPRLAFRLRLAKRHVVEVGGRGVDTRDAIQRIQERTGLLAYEEDKEYSHIKVDYARAAQSPDKPWVPLCPYNCYLLVLGKGVFTSFKDLYEYNLRFMRGSGSKDPERDAKQQTLRDIAGAQVRFDHVACVGCGTCGAIGPPEIIRFGHERFGHGVKYAYG